MALAVVAAAAAVGGVADGTVWGRAEGFSIYLRFGGRKLGEELETYLY